MIEAISLDTTFATRDAAAEADIPMPEDLGELGEYQTAGKAGRRRDGSRLQGPAHQAQATRGD